MDEKRKCFKFSEVDSGRMRFAPVKDRSSKEKKRVSTAVKEGPSTTKKVQRDVKAKTGYLRYRLGETCPESVVQFSKEIFNAKQDASWPEVCQVRRTESSCLPIEASFVRLPRTTICSTSSTVAAGSTAAPTPHQRVATDNSAGNKKETTSGFEKHGDVGNCEDGWFGMVRTRVLYEWHICSVISKWK